MFYKRKFRSCLVEKFVFQVFFKFPASTFLQVTETHFLLGAESSQLLSLIIMKYKQRLKVPINVYIKWAGVLEAKKIVYDGKQLMHDWLFAFATEQAREILNQQSMKSICQGIIRRLYKRYITLLACQKTIPLIIYIARFIDTFALNDWHVFFPT